MSDLMALVEQLSEAGVSVSDLQEVQKQMRQKEEFEKIGSRREDAATIYKDIMAAQDLLNTLNAELSAVIVEARKLAPEIDIDPRPKTVVEKQIAESNGKRKARHDISIQRNGDVRSVLYNGRMDRPHKFYVPIKPDDTADKIAERITVKLWELEERVVNRLDPDFVRTARLFIKKLEDLQYTPDEVAA